MKCSIEDCDKKAYVKGLCSTHYKRQWRHSDALKTLTPTRGFERIQCIADELVPCENISAYGCGLCENHYQMQRMYGRTRRTINGQGNGTINAAGYVVIPVNGKPTYEHIHLAERALGKPLPKGAVVHHMNEKKNDNYTPFNLVICPDQSYHMLLHKRMRDLGL